MRPTLRAVLLFAAAFPVALVPVLASARLWTVWLAWLGFAALLVGVDAVLGLPRRRLRATVHAPATLYIGERDPLEIELAAPRGRAADVEIVCDLHEDLEPQPAQTVRLTPAAPGRAAVTLAPRRRGTVAVRALWLRWAGPFGLMRRTTRVAVDREIAVLPNVRAVRAAALRFFASRQSLQGLKVERYIGDGSEFESLREYVVGMDSRSIDWKSSARHRKVLAQEFRAERNHQIILAVDCGHLMREPLEGIPRLDHAVNAALLLSYLGLRTGDRIGLYSFDEKPRSFVEPQGGVGAFPRLQAAASEIDYSTGETNFTLGLAELSTRLRRRSLVVLLTDFVDVVTAELMLDNLDRLARRHLTLFVSLSDPGLGDLAGAAPRRLPDVYRAVVAADLSRERELVLKRLKRLGILTVDAAPGQISAQLLSRYLEIKRRELI
jgi:uncharacterized protein (DUF58 family)